MADMVQDNLCCSRSVVDWPKVTRSLLGAVSFLVIGLLVLYGMLKQGIHEIREIHPPLNMRQTVYGNGRSRASVPSRIELNGDFGAVSLSFRSKEKRDELYLALVRVHHIGRLIPTG